MQNGFFKVISRVEFEELLRGFKPLGTEHLSIEQCADRVLRADLTATHDWPLTDRSCMDGYAVNARDIFGATESNPGYLECVGELHVDDQPDMELHRGECMRISTGGSLPEGADAVVMVEHTLEMDGGTIEIHKTGAPGLNVMQRGEDVSENSIFLESGSRIRPQEAGLAAAMGFAEIEVGKRPRVGILSTGDELVPVTETPRPGKVRDVNSYTLSMFCQAAGAETTMYGMIRDELEPLTEALRKAVSENDVVLLSGGSSVGVRDFTIDAIKGLDNSEIMAHGVAISPGKPAILGRSANTPVMGLPGQVASAQVVMLMLVAPLLRHLQGDSDAFNRDAMPSREAELARNVPSKPGREDYVRIRFEEREGQLPLAHPLMGKSGLLRTMVGCQALAMIPADSEGIYKGAVIKTITT